MCERERKRERVFLKVLSANAHSACMREREREREEREREIIFSILSQNIHRTEKNLTEPFIRKVIRTYLSNITEKEVDFQDQCMVTPVYINNRATGCLQFSELAKEKNIVLARQPRIVYLRRESIQNLPTVASFSMFEPVVMEFFI